MLHSSNDITSANMQACNHPYLFLEGPAPAAQQGAGAAANGHAAGGAVSAAHSQLVRASGKLAFLAHALPKLRAAGAGTSATPHGQR